MLVTTVWINCLRLLKKLSWTIYYKIAHQVKDLVNSYGFITKAPRLSVKIALCAYSRFKIALGIQAISNGKLTISTPMVITHLNVKFWMFVHLYKNPKLCSASQSLTDHHKAWMIITKNTIICDAKTSIKISLNIDALSVPVSWTEKWFTPHCNLSN